MPNDLTRNRGEGNPEAATRFNRAETRFVESTQGQKKARDGTHVSATEQLDLEEAERLGKARSKGDDPTASTPIPDRR